jgi:hypothetical protein
MFPETFVPLHVPPAGDSPVSVTIPLLSHTAVKEESVTVGAVFTVIVCMVMLEQPFASVYEYMMDCVPAVGSNIFPDTPVPLHVPPAGDSPVSVIIPALSQVGAKEESVTVGAAFTGKACDAMFEQPFPSVYMYMMVCDPAEGSNMFPETFVPLHVPPAGDSPVSVTIPPLSQTAVKDASVTVGAVFTVIVPFVVCKHP